LVPDVDIKFRPADVVRPDIIVAPLVEGRAPRSFDETRRLLLVVEILSPSSVNRDRRAKKALYTRMRVPEYWIVDRTAQVVERWRPGATSAEILRDTIEWRPETASDPFVLDLRALFRLVAGE
jgi:Uma2 family endonuclease